MAELRIAMIQNDRALELLIRGDYRNAEEYLKQSFISIRKVIHYNDAGVGTASIALQLAFPILPSSDSFQDRIIPKLCHSELFIYNRPVYFSKCSLFGENEYNDLAKNHASTLGILCSAIVLFNMALLLHLRGIHGDKSSLMRAKHLYISTFQLMKNLNASRFFSDMVSELYLTSVNNYALICVDLEENKQAQDAAHSMRSIFSSARRRPGGFSEEEWDGFAINIGWIISLSLPKSIIRCRCAPAA